jgi:hypothetical protein
MPFAGLLSKRASRRRLAAAVLAVMSFTSAGCGKQTRFDITGQVTFDGRPVPAGTVTFIPAGKRQAEAGTGFARIHAGRFATREGRSPGSGPHRVMVNGCDGVPFESRLGDVVDKHPMGKDLFTSHVVEVDLPAKSGFVLDIAVPKAPEGLPSSTR